MTVTSAIRRRQAATSPRGPQIETFGNGFFNQDSCFCNFESVEGQSRNTFQGDNKNSLFSNQQRELVMMNPFLSVSDSGGIKGGAGDSLSPSLSSV